MIRSHISAPTTTSDTSVGSDPYGTPQDTANISAVMDDTDKMRQFRDDALANGLGALTKRASTGLPRLQNGFVRSYALAVLLGVVVILGYLILK